MIKVDKLRFDEFLDKLAKTYRVFAPVAAGRISSFQQITAAADIGVNIVNTSKSPKELFFPQAELLFRYDEESITDATPAEKPLAIWGVRPCDARSFTMLDKVFGKAVQKPDDKNFQDSFWKSKYDNSLIFVTACNEPASTCFCNWFESGPHDEAGADVFVVEMVDYYLLKPVSEKGRLFCNQSDLEAAADKAAQQAAELKNKAEAAMSNYQNLASIADKLPTLWNDSFWDEVSAKCINCGACTYACSTCHCFDVQDERKGRRGTRVRLWDSCMFPDFTKEASGHNPRSLSKERVRQRVMHKFNYFVEKYEEFLCTGCGRCVLVCPVNFDIREVIKKIAD